MAGRDGTRTIATPRFVNAAGPFAKAVGRLLGIELPLFCERHAKVAFHDTLGVVPRHAPMMIWTDPVRLPWTEEERADLAEAESLRHLLHEMPAGVHGRPEGGGDSPVMLGVWTYDVEPMEPRFPVEFDPAYAEIVLRGLTRPLPGLSAYLARFPKCFVDGGYYTKTRENRLLSGPLRSAGRLRRGAAAASLRGSLSSEPLRRPRLPRAARELGGFRTALAWRGARTGARRARAA